MEENINQDSPQWSSTTKLIVGLTFVAILAGLLIRFQQFLGANPVIFYRGLFVISGFR